MTTPQREWLTVTEYADYYRVSPRTVSRWIAEDPNMRIKRLGPSGRMVRIHVSELHRDALPAA